MGVGVVIGRFQINELHNGHYDILSKVENDHPGEFLILLGVGRTPPTARNPLPFRARADMLHKAYPSALILPLRDCQTDKQWSDSIDRLISSVFGYRKATIYSGRDGCLTAYVGHHETKEILSTVDSESATERRNALSVAPIDSPDFRAGVIYAINNHPPRIYNTVDMALVRTIASGEGFHLSNIEILLGKKVDDDRWRLPGGMVDHSDQTYVRAAARETMEETGLCPGIPEFQYICDMTIYDWRAYGNPDVQYHTTLFTAKCLTGMAAAGDDLAKIEWFPLTSTVHVISGAHLPLIKATKEYWDND